MGNKFSSPLASSKTRPGTGDHTQSRGDVIAKSHDRPMSDSTSKEINASYKVAKRSPSDNPSTGLGLDTFQSSLVPLKLANASFLEQPSAYLKPTTALSAATTDGSTTPLESIAAHLLPSFHYSEHPTVTKITAQVIFLTPQWHGEPTNGRPCEYVTTALLVGKDGEDFAREGFFAAPKGVKGRLTSTQLLHVLEYAGVPINWSTTQRLQNLTSTSYQLMEITPGGPTLHVVRLDRDPTYKTVSYVDALGFVAASYPALRTPLRAAVIGVADDPAWASLPPPGGQLATYLQETTTKSLLSINKALLSVNAVYDDSAGHPSLYLLADKTDVSTMTRLVGQHVKAGTLDESSERLYCTAVARRMDRYLLTFGQLEPELLHLEWGPAQKGNNDCLSAVYTPPSGPKVRMDIGVDTTLFNSLRQADDSANPANIKKRLMEAIREETRPFRRDSRLTASPHCSECDIILKELWEAQNPDEPLPDGMAAAELHHVVTVAELYHTYCEPVADPSALLRPPPNHHQFKPCIPRDSIRSVLQVPSNTTWLCHSCHLEITQVETTRQRVAEVVADIKLSPSLTAHQRERVEQMVEKHVSAFAEGPIQNPSSLSQFDSLPAREPSDSLEQMVEKHITAFASKSLPNANARKSSADLGFPLAATTDTASTLPPTPSHATAWWTVVALGQANGFIPVIRSPSRPDVVLPPQESPTLSSYVNSLPPLPNVLTPQAIAMAALMVASYLAGCRSSSLPFPSPPPSPPSSPVHSSGDDSDADDPAPAAGVAGDTPPDDTPAVVPATTPFTPAKPYEEYVSTPRPVIPSALGTAEDAQMHLDAMQAYCDQCLKQIHDEKEEARIRMVAAAQAADAALAAQRSRAEAAEQSLASSVHQCTELHASVTSLRAEHTTLHVEISTLQARYDQTAAALSTARQDVAQATDNLSAAQSQVSTLQRQCTRLQQVRAQLEEALDTESRSSVSRALTVVDDTELANLRDSNLAKDATISLLKEEVVQINLVMSALDSGEVLEGVDESAPYDSIDGLRTRLLIVKTAYRHAFKDLEQARIQLSDLQLEVAQTNHDHENALSDLCETHQLALQSLKDEQSSVQTNLESKLEKSELFLRLARRNQTDAPQPQTRAASQPPPAPPPAEAPTKEDLILSALAKLSDRISTIEQPPTSQESRPDPEEPASVASAPPYCPGSHGTTYPSNVHPRPLSVPLASVRAGLPDYRPAPHRPASHQDEASNASGEGPMVEEALAFYNLTPEQQLAQLPPTVDRAHIIGVLNAREDSTASRWRRRQLFVKEVVQGRAAVLDQGTNYVHRGSSAALKAITDLSFDSKLGDKDGNVQAKAWSGLRSRFINAFHDVLITGCNFAVVLRKLMEVSNVDLPNSRGNRRVHSYAKLALDEGLHHFNPVLCADAFIYKLDTSYRTDHYGSDSVDANWNALNSRHVDDDCDTLAEAVISAYIEKLNSDAWNSTNIWTEPHHVETVNNKYAECLLCDLADTKRGDENYARFIDSWKQTQTDVNASKCPHSDLSCAVIAFKYIRSKEASTAPQDLLARRSALLASKEAESKPGRGAAGRHAGALNPPPPPPPQAPPPQAPPPPPAGINNVNVPPTGIPKGLGKGNGKGYRGGRGNGTPPPSDATLPPPPPPQANNAAGYTYPAAGQTASSSRNVTHPTGSTGNPRKVNGEAAPWTQESWKSTILDFTYLHSCSPTSADDALRHCWPCDATFSTTSPVRPKSNEGAWAIDSCLYCFHRPRADPKEPAAAADHPENWWYGTGQGNHNPYRCKALKRYLAEGGDLATHPQFAVNLRGCLRVDPQASK